MEPKLTKEEVRDKISKLSKDFNVEKPDVEFKNLIERMEKGAYDRGENKIILDPMWLNEETTYEEFYHYLQDEKYNMPIKITSKPYEEKETERRAKKFAENEKIRSCLVEADDRKDVEACWEGLEEED